MATASNRNTAIIAIAVIVLAAIGYLVWKDQQSESISLSLPGGKSAEITVSE